MEARGKTVYLPVLEVKDSPRFAWRGLSLDVSRCFFTVEEVKQVIDMISLYKMNVLHIHLTDNQGWRIEIKKYPNLTATGGHMSNEGRKGGYYTQEQFRELVEYAASRFITVVPEIDIPGHTAAMFASYPELKNAVTLDLNLNIAGQALGALDADDAETMQFVEDVITELAAITPGSYLHIGGDETMGLSDEKFIRFINQTRQFVLNNRKKMVGWQEICRADIKEGDLFQHWIYLTGNMDQTDEREDSMISSLPPEVLKLLMETFSRAGEDVEKGVSKQAGAIVSPSGFVYLDHRYLEPSADPLQTDEQERLGMPAYPKQTIEQMYNWDPSTFNPILRASENIAGVEAAIWCETISNFRELQFLLMPRLAGVAEKGWSKVEHTNWDEYKVRLSSHPPLWEQADWNYFKSSLVDWK
ncbi:MAG: family 20 glycosylhydrolase [Tannerellaceae bacterium]|nr:family 20 glycosylhydrolase [Tannerellaceae bacterium]